MNRKIKNIIRSVVPPVALEAYRLLFRSTVFFGNYKSWDEARKASGGYNTDVILNKVKDALLRVKNGEAVYERDSVLFQEVQYSWPLLAGLLLAASQCNNRINLLDFGGSLGSTYYQNLKFLTHLREVRWNIVEQMNFVTVGKRYFEHDQLKFYNSIEQCFKETTPDILLLSSVLPYVEKPYELIKEIISRECLYIIIDRTPFLEKGDDRITVQKVPQEIYKASYPAWFFNHDKFLKCFTGTYEIVAEFDALAGSINLGNALAHDKGFIFRKKD